MAQFSNRAKVVVIIFFFIPPIYAIRFPASIDHDHDSEGNGSNEALSFTSENIIIRHGGAAKVIARIMESVPSPGVGH
jgi:hypothetical protein